MKVSQKSANRYAQALFHFSEDEKKTDVAYHNLQAIRHLIDRSHEFNAFLQDPTIPSAKRRSILKEIFEKKIDPIIFHFLLFLEEKNRLPVLNSICQGFEQIYSDAKGILKVILTSRWELSTEEIHQISHFLKNRFHKTIVPESKVDPSILGGIKIQINDVIYDYSLQTQLNKFKQSVINS